MGCAMACHGILPWHSHFFAMVLRWDCHGVSHGNAMTMPWLMRHSMFMALPMACPWHIHCIAMACSWHTNHATCHARHGCTIDVPWFIPWSNHGHAMVVPRSCMVRSWQTKVMDATMANHRSCHGHLSSTVDMMFVVRRLQELARKDTSLYMCFIDLTKAYDSIDRSFL